MTTSKNQRRPWFGGDTFEQLIAILMTLVVIQTAVVTYWFTLADDSNGDAGRDAQIFAMRGLSQQTVGSLKAGYDLTGAYQRWVELNTLAKISDEKGDVAAAERYRAVRDRVAKLSPLLQPPYFDPENDTTPDISRYEADTYVVETVALAERFANQANLKSAWFDKASAFTTHITLLAVALFLFGLAATNKSRIRWIFVLVGFVIAAGTLVWMLWANFQPVNSLSDDAIKAYARGAGLAYQGKSAEAIAAYDDALKLAPTYASALRDRGLAELNLYQYESAAKSFEQARAAGDASSETAGNLAWTYYLLGKFPESIALNRVALKTSPDEMWIHYNLALDLLAAGQNDAAKSEYTQAIDATITQVARATAAKKQPSATLWWSIDAAADDLDLLLACVNRQECDDTAPAKAIANTDAVKRTADELRTQLKELSVALEYTGKPPSGTVAATIKPFRFAQELDFVNDELTNIKARQVFTDTETPVYVIFDYAGMNKGQLIVIKVFQNGVEDPRLRVVQEFGESDAAGTDTGFAISTGGIPFAPGKYRVEMYIDSRLKQAGEFTLQEP